MLVAAYHIPDMKIKVIGWDRRNRARSLPNALGIPNFLPQSCGPQFPPYTPYRPSIYKTPLLYTATYPCVT